MTRAQFDLLRFIVEAIATTGIPPSYPEMMEGLGLRSKSGVHRLVTALEARGYIRRYPKRARAIEIVKLPAVLSSGRALAVARSDAKFDGRTFDGLGRIDRQRYLERAQAGLRAGDAVLFG